MFSSNIVELSVAAKRGATQKELYQLDLETFVEPNPQPPIPIFITPPKLLAAIWRAAGFYTGEDRTEEEEDEYIQYLRRKHAKMNITYIEPDSDMSDSDYDD